MRRLATLFIIPIIGLSMMGTPVSGWKLDSHGFPNGRNVVDGTATPAPLPTFTPVILAGSTTPPDRVLPPIGGNAGLVLGASVLVLIIIGGVVLTSRRKPKH